MADDDGQEWFPEDYDKKIKLLREERDQLQNKLDDPDEQKKRRTRRAQLVGEYATRSSVWNDPDMDGIRKVAAKTDEGWLFEVGWLQHDGWSHDDKKGNWHTPKS